MQKYNVFLFCQPKFLNIVKMRYAVFYGGGIETHCIRIFFIVLFLANRGDGNQIIFSQRPQIGLIGWI